MFAFEYVLCSLLIKVCVVRNRSIVTWRLGVAGGPWSWIGKTTHLVSTSNESAAFAWFCNIQLPSSPTRRSATITGCLTACLTDSCLPACLPACLQVSQRKGFLTLVSMAKL
jgi:hypothetical protein